MKTKTMIIAGGAAIVAAYLLTRKNTFSGIDCGWMVPQYAKMGDDSLPELPALPPLSAEEIAALSPEMQEGLAPKKSIVPIALAVTAAAFLLV